MVDDKREKAFQFLINFTFRSNPKEIFSTDSKWMVEQAEKEREHLEKNGCLVVTLEKPELGLYQLFVCLNSNSAKVLLKAKINSKIKEKQKHINWFIDKYEKTKQAFEELKESL